jgi:hypothetical protein
MDEADYSEMEPTGNPEIHDYAPRSTKTREPKETLDADKVS